MCGRFTLTVEAAAVQQEFDLGQMPKRWMPRYNVAPTQPIAVVLDAKSRYVTFMYWGLVPSWAKDVSIGAKLINARSETLSEKPSFKNAFKRRRCLILADGFYEWQKPMGRRGPKIPHYFKRKDGKPFMLAGLWEQWQSSEGSELVSTAIITCPPNAMVKPIHSRMPVILDKNDIWDWVKPGEMQYHQSMLKPYPADQMDVRQVSNKVNSAHFEGIECIQSGDSQPSLF